MVIWCWWWWCWWFYLSNEFKLLTPNWFLIRDQFSNFAKLDIHQNRNYIVSTGIKILPKARIAQNDIPYRKWQEGIPACLFVCLFFRSIYRDRCPRQMMLWGLDVTLADEDTHSKFAAAENEVEDSVGKTYATADNSLTTAISQFSFMRACCNL